MSNTSANLIHTFSTPNIEAKAIEEDATTVDEEVNKIEELIGCQSTVDTRPKRYPFRRSTRERSKSDVKELKSIVWRGFLSFYKSKEEFSIVTQTERKAVLSVIKKVELKHFSDKFGDQLSQSAVKKTSQLISKSAVCQTVVLGQNAVETGHSFSATQHSHLSRRDLQEHFKKGKTKRSSRQFEVLFDC